MNEKEPNKGWIAIHRKTPDSEIWGQEPWRLKTWFYLLMEANHTEDRRFGRKLERGQLYMPSIEELCKRIGWQRGFVCKRPTVNAMKKFWQWLRKRNMVSTKKTTRGTIITILNYRKYQDIQEGPVGTKQFPVAGTTQAPVGSNDRQPLKQYKQLNKKNTSSFKKPKPYYRGEEMRWYQNKWWVVPKDGGPWLEFVDLEKKIEWKK